jgi:hypothetical protein
VKTFSPKLVFDVREKQADLAQLQVYWQVSPAKLADTYGVNVTMIMAWPYDYGPSSDWEGVSSWWDKWYCEIADAVVDFQYAAQHCGDTEGVRFFVTYGDGTSWDWDQVRDSDPQRGWHLTHIDWKRHSERFNDPGDPIPVSRIQGLQFEGEHHPILYVSGRKHAMYPNLDECKKYTHTEKLCTVRFELCQPGVSFVPETPFLHNVGERPPKGHPLLDELPEYAGERAWGTEPFCGGMDDLACLKIQQYADVPLVGAEFPTCSGGMGNMWFP